MCNLPPPPIKNRSLSTIMGANSLKTKADLGEGNSSVWLEVEHETPFLITSADERFPAGLRNCNQRASILRAGQEELY